MGKQKIGADVIVLYCGEEQATAGSRYGPVIRSVYIWECCTGGNGSVIINGQEFPVQGGDSYILLPGDTVIHTSSKTQPRQGYWCALDGLTVGSHIAEAGITSQSPFVPPEYFHDIAFLMQRMSTQWNEHDAGAVLRQNACVYGLLGTLLREKSPKQRETAIEQAIGLIETNYPDPLSVTDLAQEVGLARAYFSTLFKEKTGRSPYQYLNTVRIQKACELLKNGKYSVAEVADLVGLDSHNFARLFKREIGKNPTEYQKDISNWKNPIVARETLSPIKRKTAK